MGGQRSQLPSKYRITRGKSGHASHIVYSCAILLLKIKFTIMTQSWKVHTGVF